MPIPIFTADFREVNAHRLPSGAAISIRRTVVTELTSLRWRQVHMRSWDRSAGFLFVGSGAAAMTTALGVHDLWGKVLIVEKAAVCGGSTAVSGRVVWPPTIP